MAINYDTLRATQLGVTRQAYGRDACILYALGVGAGLAADSGLGHETDLLFEEGLQVLPSMATVMAYPGFWMRDAKHGIDWRHVVHGEQRMRFHAAIPPQGEVQSRTRVLGVTDKGPGRGAVVVSEREIADSSTGHVLARIEQVNFCRADGGYSQGESAQSDAPLPAIPKPPSAAATRRFSVPTSPNQAAIYRLCGDRNPLHIHHASARDAGFDSPILHGAALLGIVDRVLTHRIAGKQRLSTLDIRFTGSAYPGELLAVDLWDAQQGWAFRCRVAADNRELAYGAAAWTDREPLHAE